MVEEILHQLIGSFIPLLHGFIHLRWLAGFLPSTVCRTKPLAQQVTSKFFVMNRATTGLVSPFLPPQVRQKIKDYFWEHPVAWAEKKKGIFWKDVLRDIHYIDGSFWKCGRQKYIHLFIHVIIYMTPNRRYMGDFFISTESYRTSVIVKNTPKPHIVKAARLDLLVPQPTFWKGRLKGEQKNSEFRQYLLGTYPKWGNIPFRKSPSVCNPCAWNQPVFIIWEVLFSRMFDVYSANDGFPIWQVFLDMGVKSRPKVPLNSIVPTMFVRKRDYDYRGRKRQQQRKQWLLLETPHFSLPVLFVWRVPA